MGNMTGLAAPLNKRWMTMLLFLLLGRVLVAGETELSLGKRRF